MFISLEGIVIYTLQGAPVFVSLPLTFAVPPILSIADEYARTPFIPILPVISPPVIVNVPVAGIYTPEPPPVVFDVPLAILPRITPPIISNTPASYTPPDEIPVFSEITPPLISIYAVALFTTYTPPTLVPLLPVIVPHDNSNLAPDATYTPPAKPLLSEITPFVSLLSSALFIANTPPATYTPPPCVARLSVMCPPVIMNSEPADESTYTPPAFVPVLPVIVPPPIVKLPRTCTAPDVEPVLPVIVPFSKITLPPGPTTTHAPPELLRPPVIRPECSSVKSVILSTPST